VGFDSLELGVGRQRWVGFDSLELGVGMQR
jgi:hypothetical protein